MAVRQKVENQMEWRGENISHHSVPFLIKKKIKQKQPHSAFITAFPRARRESENSNNNKKQMENIAHKHL